MAECISNSLFVEDRIASVEDVLTDPLNFKLINSYLDGSSGQRQLFVSIPDPPHGTVPFRISFGETEPITGKAVYFLRTIPSDKGVRLDVGSNDEVLFGELSCNDSPVECLNTCVNGVFKPYIAELILSGVREPWGSADSLLQKEFSGQLAKFAIEMNQIMESIAGGIQLKTSPEIDALIAERAPQPINLAEFFKDARNAKLVKLADVLMGEWIKQIEQYTAATFEEVARRGADKENSDPGPRTEIDQWRFRVQRITFISEQLKTLTCRTVLGILHGALIQRSGEPLEFELCRPNASLVLKRWRLLDLSVHESLVAAKDNLKYLSSLDKYLEPLYSGVPKGVIDTLPAMYNALKMIHSVARFYGNKERMTYLMSKITNQLVTNCRAFIGGSMWDEPEVIARLEICLDLVDKYQAEYKKTLGEISQTEGENNFAFNLITVFGKLDLFVRRLRKLVDMFALVGQFDQFNLHRFDGMEGIVANFLSVKEEFRNKRHDLLDFYANRFDRDYVEFTSKIGEIERKVRGFIDTQFALVDSISGALRMLKKFEDVITRESLRRDLSSKLDLIFHKYSLELDRVQDMYERLKSNPPIGRNLPPVAGNIAWSRHLLKRIEDPMEFFKSHTALISSGTKEAKLVVRQYNRLAKTLVEFETVWFQAWVNSVDEAKGGLSVNILVRHPDDGDKLYVNMDPEVMQLLREAKLLDRMGNEIPNTARLVLAQETRYKQHFAELDFFVKEYRRITAVEAVVDKLMEPHIAHLDLVIKPALMTLTWTSLNIDPFLETAWKELRRFENLLKSVMDCIANRVDLNLKLVSQMILVKLPVSVVSLHEFVALQEKHVAELTLTLLSKSKEVEAAVDHILKLLVNYPHHMADFVVSESELVKFKSHYNWSMYHSLLNCTRKSLLILKARMAAKNDATCLFEVGLELDGVGVRLGPSLIDVQLAVNEGAVAILKTSRSIQAWDTLVPSDALDSERSTLGQGTFYDRIVQDKEILKSILLLTGSIQSSKADTALYLAQFRQHAWLWETDPEEVHASLFASPPPDVIGAYSQKLQEFTNVKQFNFLKSTQIGALLVKTGGLESALAQLVDRWIAVFAKQLHKRALAALESLSDEIGETRKRVGRVVEEGDIEGLGHVMKTLCDVRKQQSEMDSRMDPVKRMYLILDGCAALGKDEQDLRASLPSAWTQLVDESNKRQSELSHKQGEYRAALVATIGNFRKDVLSFKQTYDDKGPMVAGIEPGEAVERLKRFKEEYEVRARKCEIYRIGEDLFGLNYQQYPALEATGKELGYLSQLYDLYTLVVETIRGWKEKPWSEVPNEIENMRIQTDVFAAKCRKMPKQLKEWRAYHDLKRGIDDFADVLPLLVEMAKKSVQPRHWAQLRELTNGSIIDEDVSNVKLQVLIDANLNRFKDEIVDICDSADKQLVIERRIAEIQTQWAAAMFDFNIWKARDYPCVLGGGRVGEMQEQLEETMMALNTMNAMRHSVPFKEQLGSLLFSLSDTMDTIERWTKVQLLWTGLESVFTGGDIAKQMPVEAKKFLQIDKDWVRIMAKSAEIRLVVPCCQNDMLKQLLPVLGAGLESCQKSLESYLEGKRNKFPRFYFVSDPVLLKILSQGADPQNIQEDLEKLFDSVSRVQFDKVDKRKIVKLKAIVGNAEEILDLTTPMMAQGNIEDWLAQLELEMQKAVRRESKSAAQLTGSILSSVSLKEFADRFIAQVSLLGIQMVWTTDFQDALIKLSRDKDRAIMAATSKKFQQMLADLVGICLTDLGSKMNRTKFETLVTIHVHQRDLFVDIWKKVKEHRVKDESDFEWLKQTRFYWKFDLDHAIVSIADVDFTYSYEYLGVKERLVITPLTDRCYLTLSQALGICYGGAPAGPAGTGKTETVKDLSRGIGVYCVVTNCSDQHRSQSMAKILIGTCSAGLWQCFDEFNRIDLEVLSVVAMQIEAITLAKKQHAKSFMFPGESVPVRLMPNAAYFITMNPGYAGRQNLPENLKALFRGVSMMVPDREIIMRVKLASVGYSQMDLLGKKFNILYQLCEQQLSKQRHYDFGLRNILSVLRTAGGVKRTEPPDADEEMLFMRTARDMNLSKLVADDVPLFLALLKDLFPRVADPPKKSYAEIEQGVEKLVRDRKLVLFEPWKLKVIQLYETSLVRHGLMLVGPTLCGKTEIMNVLTSCLTESANSPHRIVTLNPKAITDSQMYGVKDVLSDEWTPGVFASIWQKYNNRALKYTTWIVCDGPVDAIWIENLNSVLDDNKILTLANNDRIAMTDNCRIIFEVENLNNASPATVSRAGIIFVSASDLGWEPLVESWLLHRAEVSKNVDVLKVLIQKWIKAPELMEYIRRNLEPVMPVNDSVMITNFLNLLSGLLSADNLTNDDYARILLYALVWAFGGLLEAEDRGKFHLKISHIVKQSGYLQILPTIDETGLTLFEFYPSAGAGWSKWAPSKWVPPKKLLFSSLLIPTMESVRCEFLLATIAKGGRSRWPPSFGSSLIVGSSGTAKTSTVLMYLSKLDRQNVVSKRINFSSATTPFGFQKSVELEVERKTGKTFCPPGGKQMVLFIDDMSMPLVNKWGDQVTLEIMRQLMESGGFYFLEKDKRGDFKQIENLQFVGAMVNPGGGRNDIPNRMKSKLFSFAMTMPNLAVVDSIYGSILRARFGTQAVLTSKLTSATIAVWEHVKKSLLPTPARFHYVFNLRELSRVFQGIMEAPIVQTDECLVSLWRHECTRVFSDKLSRASDKELVRGVIAETRSRFFDEIALTGTDWWADFQREAPISEEDEELPAPKVYEPVLSLATLKKKAYSYLEKFNEAMPSKQMNLVLFEDALEHLLKIVRIIQQKRGSAMLVGVGGSGKQSLTRLAAYISRQRIFQVAITKSYNENAFLDDLRNLFVDCGQKNNPVTFILTDADIKDEQFLEHMNSVMATGEVAGLFQKDERDSMCAEIRPDFVRDRPGLEDSLSNLSQFFTDRVRDNLHIVYCFSPVNAKFAIRAQKFPAIFANANINWFLPWPEAALTAVSSTFLADCEIDASSASEKTALYEFLGAAHAAVNEVCTLYYQVMRRRVYVTPKNFLCLIQFYTQLYTEKYAEVNRLEKSVNLGLGKLNEAAADVERLKVDLREEEKNLKIAELETNSLLIRVESETINAQAKAGVVGGQKDACLANKAEIEGEQAEAEKDLQAALPYLEEAETAVKSITAKDITELKTLKQPSDIIRLVFDGLLILQQRRIGDVKMETKNVNKQAFAFIHDSYDEISKSVLTDIRFLPDLMEFSEIQKDAINDETCELLEPYLRLVNFNPAVAKKASGACEGLCKWVRAMAMYHEAAKIVKPKMDYLKVQGAKLAAAMAELALAEAELQAAMDAVAQLNAQFAAAMERKTGLEKSANATRAKMDQAEKLIRGLAGEKVRWGEDARNFADRRKQLVGDVALAAVFITYCGAFNSEFRDKLVVEFFVPELQRRRVPHTANLNIVKFMVDEATIGEWTLEGLPSDDLSIQNAIMVTQSSRFPLLVDPQGQAVRWIRSREAKRIAQSPAQCVTTLANPRLKDQLEFTMGEGLALLIENVEDEVDPLLDPLLDKAIVKKGKKFIITVSDQQMDFSPRFSLYLTSRLPNPHFSPELSAKCAVIDFTVTLKGLEQQLLGRVLGAEQKALEESLSALMEEVTRNRKSLQILDAQLLERLSNSSGNLLDDVALIEVLANTKATAKEVEAKIADAEEKKKEINLKREQYRPVATRGSVMYFCLTDMTLISNPITLQPTGWMYNVSLVQFLAQFDLSIRSSEKCQPTAKRVEKIIDYLTYQVYRYMNRGLFERDKMLFKLMVTLRIQLVAKSLNAADVGILLRGGSALDIKSEKPNLFPKWMPDKVWLNVVQLTRHVFGKSALFAKLVETIKANEVAWRSWYDENEPEACAVPDFAHELNSFTKLVLVRSFREDRTTIAAAEYIANQLDAKFTKPVTDSIESIYAESVARKPIIYLLSSGSDPTSMIDELAKKKKRFPTDKVSMGEGQEVIAFAKMKSAFLTGAWVVLQNCHLGLGFMNQLEDILTTHGSIDEDFRLWLTCEVTNRFPIGLLQMSIKVTLEPPMGLKAGLYRTYTTAITQELIDKVDSDKWRRIVYIQAFLHSLVQERRKFGPIGWCVPYEFNNSDMEASLLFLEKHLSTTVMVGQPLSWNTIQYMVAEVQYGGRITDDLDRELFNTYAAKWLCEEVMTSSDSSIPDGLDIQVYRDAIETLPAVDSPVIFGLHPNADLNYRQLEASMLLSTIQETQPKEGGDGASGSKTRDEVVREKAEEILARVPPDFVEEVYREKISKLKGPPGLAEKGFQAPLNIFLFQEIQRLQRVISIVRSNLTDLVMAIDGTVVMTPELLEDMNQVFDARIPKSWTHDASGAEISWLQPNLGTWFTGLLDRVVQLSTWLETGRQKAYWLTGFLNAQGFLTAMRQEVTRQHKKDQWALDDVVTHTEVLSVDLDKIRDVPEEGQNIYGLFLEGAKWNRAEGKLEESDPKKLFTQMPVIYVTAVTAKEKKAKNAEYGPFGPFDCPVYKYPKRTDKYLIFRMNLKTEQAPSNWKLRGVSLNCSTE